MKYRKKILEDFCHYVFDLGLCCVAIDTFSHNDCDCFRLSSSFLNNKIKNQKLQYSRSCPADSVSAERRWSD